MPGKQSNIDYGKSKPYNMSLYDYHTGVILNVKKKMGFLKDAQALQHIIEYYDRNNNKQFMKNLLLFIGYPVIITFIFNYVANKIFDINNSMTEEGLQFAALYRFGSALNLFGFASFAFLATCIFLFIYIMKKRGY